MQREDTGVSHNAGGRGGLHPILKSAALAFVATLVSLAVKEGSVNTAYWKSGAYLVRGFPIPYLTYNECDFSICDFNGQIFRPPPSFHLFYAIADFAVWFAIAIGIVLVITSARSSRSIGLLAVVGFVAGLGVTFVTLLFPPLAPVYPSISLESMLNYIGGFPLEYFIEGVIAFPAAHPSTFQYFSIVNFMSDLVFWTLVSFALIGAVTRLFMRSRPVRVTQETIPSHVGNSLE